MLCIIVRKLTIEKEIKSALNVEKKYNEFLKKKLR